ncbi:hypothetical protein MPSEU_000467400 [Mayamaea pseudoterrestris]|nr:hypothetical protein MPSEU_000467400 [Mayamaea pseudoterrestris]
MDEQQQRQILFVEQHTVLVASDRQRSNLVVRLLSSIRTSYIMNDNGIAAAFAAEVIAAQVEPPTAIERIQARAQAPNLFTEREVDIDADLLIGFALDAAARQLHLAMEEPASEYPRKVTINFGYFENHFEETLQELARDNVDAPTFDDCAAEFRDFLGRLKNIDSMCISPVPPEFVPHLCIMASSRAALIDTLGLGCDIFSTSVFEEEHGQQLAEFITQCRELRKFDATNLSKGAFLAICQSLAPLPSLFQVSLNPCDPFEQFPRVLIDITLTENDDTQGLSQLIRNPNLSRLNLDRVGCAEQTVSDNICQAVVESNIPSLDFGSFSIEKDRGLRISPLKLKRQARGDGLMLESLCRALVGSQHRVVKLEVHSKAVHVLPTFLQEARRGGWGVESLSITFVTAVWTDAITSALATFAHDNEEFYSLTLNKSSYGDFGNMDDMIRFPLFASDELLEAFASVRSPLRTVDFCGEDYKRFFDPDWCQRVLSIAAANSARMNIADGIDRYPDPAHVLRQLIDAMPSIDVPNLYKLLQRNVWGLQAHVQAQAQLALSAAIDEQKATMAAVLAANKSFAAMTAKILDAINVADVVMSTSVSGFDISTKKAMAEASAAAVAANKTIAASADMSSLLAKAKREFVAAAAAATTAETCVFVATNVEDVAAETAEHMAITAPQVIAANKARRAALIVASSANRFSTKTLMLVAVQNVASAVATDAYNKVVADVEDTKLNVSYQELAAAVTAVEAATKNFAKATSLLMAFYEKCNFSGL